MNLEMLDKTVRRVPDFPKPGILFYDITGVLVNPDALKFVIEQMVEKYKDQKIDAVAGVESRGFIFAAPFAEKLGIPLILIRKKGKLPGDTYECSYALEYGTATIEVHKSDIKKGQNILVVDDLIATGGTIAAVSNLVEKMGGEIVTLEFLIELTGLKGRDKLNKYDVKSFVEYEF